MSEKDRELIKESESIDDWNDIKYLEIKAESPQAKRILHIRKMDLYHKEEAFADQL